MPLVQADQGPDLAIWRLSPWSPCVRCCLHSTWLTLTGCLPCPGALEALDTNYLMSSSQHLGDKYSFHPLPAAEQTEVLRASQELAPWAVKFGPLLLTIWLCSHMKWVQVVTGWCVGSGPEDAGGEGCLLPGAPAASPASKNLLGSGGKAWATGEGAAWKDTVSPRAAVRLRDCVLGGQVFRAVPMRSSACFVESPGMVWPGWAFVSPETLTEARKLTGSFVFIATQTAFPAPGIQGTRPSELAHGQGCGLCVLPAHLKRQRRRPAYLLPDLAAAG